MLQTIAKSLFGSANDRYLNKLQRYVDAINDLESEMDRFEAEGIRVILPITITPQGIKLAYIEGPDDVVIELVQAAP